jgi:integrase
VTISEELASLIYAGAAGHTPSASANGWLFPGDDDGHLSPRWVGKIMTRVLPDDWTAHTLRHRSATRAYRGTRNLPGSADTARSRISQDNRNPYGRRGFRDVRRDDGGAVSVGLLLVRNDDG